MNTCLFQAASVEDVPPIIATPHHYLINIYRNQLYYVAVVTTEGECHNITLLITVAHIIPGRVEQSVLCLTTDASLVADPGVTSLIATRPHTFVKIDHEIISTVILFPSAE